MPATQNRDSSFDDHTFIEALSMRISFLVGKLPVLCALSKTLLKSGCLIKE